MPDGTKELYVDGELRARGTQEEILPIMRLFTNKEAIEKASRKEEK